MPKLMVLFLMVGLCGPMLTACDGPGGCNAAKTIQLTEEDNGQTVAMNLVDKIEVVLPSNPSTGYQWVNMLTEGGIVVQVGDPIYEQYPECQGRDGCGGTETFHFEATQAGTGAIKLVYEQTWVNEPSKQFEVTVIAD